jgi:hypothetical protein
MKTRIICNSARCRKCGTCIESKSVHDWVQCKCGAIFVDGGKEYIRQGGNREDFEDTSIIKEVPDV